MTSNILDLYWDFSSYRTEDKPASVNNHFNDDRENRNSIKNKSLKSKSSPKYFDSSDESSLTDDDETNGKKNIVKPPYVPSATSNNYVSELFNNKDMNTLVKVRRE